MSSEISWSEDAEARLNRAPAFLRPMVRNVTEKKAREAGVTCISEAFLAGVRDTTMNAGEKPVPTIPEPGHKPIVWTKEAEARLGEIPEFTRDITRKIVEEIAAERGHLEVNCKLLDQVEALGTANPEEMKPAMEWTAEAERMLDERMAGTPDMAVQFMYDLLRVDAEDMARETNAETITAEVLKQAWERPQTSVPWAKEARARLNDAPDFVRSGIKKAAERRARREGLDNITSDDLTRFRNESMMKAVKRMKAFGFKELTFNGVFETASTRVKRLKNNPQAARRFAEIREHVEGKDGGVGLLDHEMVRKMKNYLKEDKS
ncbi:MAG: PCP reductase family protein [Mariprofundaceae bacterium]|nr:PCP reductase family protein [Mariprofundaceae bacterium]